MLPPEIAEFAEALPASRMPPDATLRGPLSVSTGAVTIPPVVVERRRELMTVTEAGAVVAVAVTSTSLPAALASNGTYVARPVIAPGVAPVPLTAQVAGLAP